MVCCGREAALFNNFGTNNTLPCRFIQSKQKKQMESNPVFNEDKCLTGCPTSITISALMNISSSNPDQIKMLFTCQLLLYFH